MSTEKTVTKETTATTKETPVVEKKETITTYSETRPDPKPQVIKETVVVEED